MVLRFFPEKRRPQHTPSHIIVLIIGTLKKVPLSHVESPLSLPDMKEEFFQTPRAVSDDFEHHQCNGFARAQRKLCMSPGGMYGLLTEGSSWIPGNSVQDCRTINKIFGSSLSISPYIFEPTDIAVSQNRGPGYRPQYAIIRTIGTPERDP